MKIVSLVASAALAAAASLAAGNPASAATCAQPGWRLVHYPESGTEEVLNSNNYGGGGVCVTNNDGDSDFAVASQGVQADGSVLAYPDLSIGCAFPKPGGSYCSTASGLPRKESALTGATLTWATSHPGAHPTDRFDTAADLWFSASAAYQTPETEVMIWLNEQNQPPPRGAVLVRIGSKEYYRWKHTASSGSFRWTFVAYLRNPQVTSVDISVKPILDNAVSADLMSAGEYCQQFAAGNEIWRGGAGLATSAFTFTP